MVNETVRPYPRKRQFDESLLLVYLLTVAAGIVMVYSTSSVLADSRFGSQWHFLRQQIIWALLSVVAIWLIQKLNLQRLALWSVPVLGAIFILLAIVFIMPARNGSHRWLFLGPLTIQPSELFKYVVLIFLAFSLSNPRRNLGSIKGLLWPYAGLVGIGLVLIVLEPDLGMSIAIFATVLGVLFLAGARLKHILSGFVPLMILAAVAVFVLGYKEERVLDHIRAIEDPLLGSYQVKQAALTLGSGGLWGTGLGEGTQKLFFLPYPHTDFIFAATGEEIGFIGLLILMTFLFIILYRGFKITAAQPDRFGFLLAGGLTWSLFVNIAINIGVVTAILPVTGLPLPFVSYGGSSLLVSSCAVGMLLNLSRRTVRP